MPSIINATLTNGLVTSADNSGSLQLQTNNGTTAVTIDTSQNVGIGTTSPLVPSSGRKVVTLNGTTDAMYNIGINGTYTGFFYSSASNTQFGSATNIPLQFYTNDTERMRIDSSGNLAVGTATPLSSRVTVAYSSGSGAGIIINQTNAGAAGNLMSFRLNNIEVGSIYQNTSTTAYNTSSDYRLKENIAPMTGALNKVLQLKPCTYTWKSTGETGEGFIAHELQAVVPDAVTGEKDAVNEDGSIKPQGIDTSFLVATLTAAIQEQQAQIEELKAEVQALKGVA